MSKPKLADGHLAVAKRLLNATEEPTESEIRCSISSSYYAAFHALAQVCANALIGPTESKHPKKAWVEVYRGLNHGVCKKACERANSVNFPECIKEFSDAFIQLQEQRHLADYDPYAKFSKADGELWYRLASISIRSLRSAKKIDQKAFSAWVLISSQGARRAKPSKSST